MKTGQQTMWLMVKSSLENKIIDGLYRNADTQFEFETAK